MDPTTPEVLPSAWSNGWRLGATQRPSPHHGPRPAGAQVDLVVLHSISLPPGEFDGDAVERLFLNRLDWTAHPYFESLRGLRVAAHFLIRRDGEICQFVSTDRRAWHAGPSAYRGRSNCNDDSIGVELEGLEGGDFENAQYTALVQLCREFRMFHPIAHVAGHEHIAPGRKHDPGPGFDWSRLRNSLGWPAAWFPKALAAGSRQA